MEGPQKAEQPHSPKIYFGTSVFGKATRCRKEDPSMFELLTWANDGFEKHSFKKKEKFDQPSEVYLNMISKYPWKSETQENYLDYNQNCIDPNPAILETIENYIDDRAPRNASPPRKMKETGLKKTTLKKVTEKEIKEIKEGKEGKKGKERKERKEGKEGKEGKERKEGKEGKEIQNNSMVQKKSTQERSTNERHEKMNKTAKGKQLTVPVESKLYEKTDAPVELTNMQKDKLIEDFKQTTRWIPNSAFTTYFGKPPFENYGRGNTNPVDGGVVYGTYLYSHNVHPHRGANAPNYLQSYPVALMKAKSQGILSPSQPRTHPPQMEDKRIPTNKISPEINSVTGLEIQIPDLKGVQKFGGKGKKTRSTCFETL